MIEHRGAVLNDSENTLSAMRYGARQGYRMFEYDVKLSRDDVSVLVHDDTLDRASNGSGRVNDYSFAQLSEYDFGAWHSQDYVGEPVVTLSGTANFSIPNQSHSNNEIKLNHASEKHTGHHVGLQAQRYCRHASPPPILSSFSMSALEAAALAAPELPRALLVEHAQEGPALIQQMLRLQCIGLNIDYRLLTPELLSACHLEELFVCVWTVND